MSEASDSIRAKDRSHAIRQIAKARNRRIRADDSRRAATADLHTWCRTAHQMGVSVMEISQVAEISRQAVYDLLGERPS